MGILLIQHHAHRDMEWFEARSRKVVRQLLDTRLMTHCRPRIRRTGGRLGRILAALTMHLVENLGLRVIRLEVVVGDGPSRRDAAVVAQLAEVALTQTE